MRSGTVVALVLAAAAAGVAAWFITRGEHASTNPLGGEVRPPALFPDLKDHVNDVATISVKRGADEFTLERTAAAWGLKEKSGYPARYEAVKGAVVGLSDLRLIEAKTTRPESYAKIGVQNPDGNAPAPPDPTADPDAPPPATPTLLTLKDDKGAILASVIVGTQKWGQTPQVYVRKAGDPQSWLADGRVEIPSDAMGWLDRQFLNIPRERVKSAVITHPDGQTVSAARQASTDPAFTVANIPAGRELSGPAAADGLGNALSYLTLDDVKPTAEGGFTKEGVAEGGGVEAGPTAVYTLFDGTVVSIRTARKDGKTWAWFAVAYMTARPEAESPAPELKPGERKPEEVEKEAADLNARIFPWAFSLPEYKTKALFPRMDDLLKPAAAPTPPPSPAPPDQPSPQLPPG